MKKFLRKSIIVAAIFTCFILLCGFDDSKERVYDNANLLSTEEEERLQESCNSVARQTQMDFVIVTTNTTEGKSDQQYADDFFDRGNYGYETNKKDPSGVLLLIDMGSRNVYISTAGFSISCISDSDIDDILDEVSPFLTKGSYYQGCQLILEKTRKVVKNSTAYTKYKDKWDENNYTGKEFYDKYIETGIFSFLRNPLCCLGIAFLIALVSVIIMANMNKSKMTANGYTYMDKNKFQFHRRSDMFIRTTVVKHKIQTESSSGGSSIHISGGGHSHGGGGHGF